MTIRLERENIVNTGDKRYPAVKLATELENRLENGQPLDENIYLRLCKTYKVGPALPLVIAGENGYNGVVQKIADPLIEIFKEQKAKAEGRNRDNWAVAIAAVKMEKNKADSSQK